MNDARITEKRFFEPLRFREAFDEAVTYTCLLKGRKYAKQTRNTVWCNVTGIAMKRHLCVSMQDIHEALSWKFLWREESRTLGDENNRKVCIRLSSICFFLRREHRCTLSFERNFVINYCVLNHIMRDIIGFRRVKIASVLAKHQTNCNILYYIWKRQGVKFCKWEVNNII